MEVNKFEMSLDLLLESKYIYEQILQTKDELDQAIYRERCSHIDTFIRKCTSQLSSGSMIQTALPSFQGDQTKITKRVQEAHAERQKQIESAQEVSFNGKSVPLKTEKL